MIKVQLKMSKIMIDYDNGFKIAKVNIILNDLWYDTL